MKEAGRHKGKNKLLNNPKTLASRFTLTEQPNY